MAAVGFGMTGVALSMQAVGESASHAPLEERGMRPGTLVHLRSVKAREAPPIPAYIVNNDNVQQADDETAKFIFGLSRNCIQDFWGE